MNRVRDTSRPHFIALTALCVLMGEACGDGGFSVAIDSPEPAAIPVVAEIDGAPVGKLPVRVVLRDPPRTLLLQYDPAIRPKGPPGMVFVPGGFFIQGSDHGNFDEKPAHRVFLDPFFIDRTEVTVGQYAMFVHATGYPPPANWKGYSEPADRRNYPVTHVTWFDAGQYADWAGRKLPTEAQWEKAARGGTGQTWPWGGEWLSDAVVGWRPSRHGPEPVGFLPENRSPYGAVDMSGNVWEWVLDSYDAGFYARAPWNHPVAESPINARVLKGGSWADRSSDRFRPAFRYDSWPQFGNYDNVGFRTVWLPAESARIRVQIDGGKAHGSIAGWEVNGQGYSGNVLRLAGLTTGHYEIRMLGALPGPPTHKYLPAAAPSEAHLTDLPPASQAEITIPEGEFTMGTQENAPNSLQIPAPIISTYYDHLPEVLGRPYPPLRPARKVWTRKYAIDRLPVTNREYREFALSGIAEKPCVAGETPPRSRLPHYWPDAKWNKDAYPVTGISWWDAQCYCAWRGKRLPTEAEWEKAARGTDARTWPWGNVFEAGRGNFMSLAELERRGVDGRPWPWAQLPAAIGAPMSPANGDGFENLAPAGFFPAGASPFGVLDMAGQVFEWTLDLYSPRRTSQRDIALVPQDNGSPRILKGGAFFFDATWSATYFRHADRPDRKEINYYGFRCVRDLP